MTESSNSTRQKDPYSADMAARLAEANQAGQWLGWSGVTLALIWWASAGFGFIALNSSGALANQAAGFIIAGLGLGILPGLILLFAGLMARQNKRTHEANLLLLQASGRLLAPAQTATDDIRNLAEATRYSTAAINQTSAAALASLKEVSEEMAAERLRVESVSYAMADNARDLTMRLAEERNALETLSRALSEQVAIMGDALPRLANDMKAATHTASSDVAKVDEAFVARIEQMKQASGTLATRLIDLDAVARDAASRTEALHATIGRIEDKLGQSKKTVEMAERASIMAVDAATQTSEALKDAVSAALDGARDANQEIAEKTQLIQDTSTRAMEALRRTGVQAANTAARVQEQSVGIASQEAPSAPDAVTLDDIKSFEQTEEAPPIRSRKSPTITEVSLKPPAKRPLKTRRVYTDEIDPIAETRPQAQDDDLFEADMPANPDTAFSTPKITTNPEPASTAKLRSNSKTKPATTSPLELGSDTSPVFLNQTRGGESHIGGEPTEWRDIIADIGNSPDEIPHTQNGAGASIEAGFPPREATAEELISRLQSSGIPLPTAFRSRDKKKIAAAARKDDHSRRRAIRNAAGGEVDRVTIRLTKDDQLMRLAQRFVSAEEAEALKALEDTGHSGRHASPRLSAYLLVDAALDPIQQN